MFNFIIVLYYKLFYKAPISLISLELNYIIFCIFSRALNIWYLIKLINILPPSSLPKVF